MSNGDTGDNSVLAILPDAFYDIIARIVPGAVAVYVCASHYTTVPLNELNVWIVLLAAYVAGFLLDVTVETVCRELLGYWFNIPGFRDDALWREVRSRGENERGPLTKMMAEIALCRNLCIVLLFVLLHGDAHRIGGQTCVYIAAGVAFVGQFAVRRWIRFILGVWGAGTKS